MLFFGKRKSAPLVQSSTEDWRKQWQDLVPPECRNVPVTVDGKTMTAYVQINHFVMMLQDGLLMQQGFFDVCAHFQRAGYHVIWLVRCTQDIAGGYLKLRKESGNECLWKWRKPTTNFGRWTSDNRYVTILLQYKPAPDGDLSRCTEHILQRVQWAESNDNSKMVPGRTEFATVGAPGTPAELSNWLARRLHVVRALTARLPIYPIGETQTHKILSLQTILRQTDKNPLALYKNVCYTSPIFRKGESNDGSYQFC